MRDSALLNYVLYQAGWVACVLGAAWHRPWAGFAVGLLLLGAHLAITTTRARDARLIAVVVTIGLVVELFHLATGTYTFASGTVVAFLPPPWLLMMWAQFATTIRFSLRPIVTRPWAAAVFGAIGGPISFVAGQSLGAITLEPPVSWGLVRLAVTWAIAMTVLAAVARAADGASRAGDSDIGTRRPPPNRATAPLA